MRRISSPSLIGPVTAQRATTNSKVVLPTVHLGPLLANRLQSKDYANRLLLRLCFERPKALTRRAFLRWEGYR